MGVGDQLSPSELVRTGQPVLNNIINMKSFIFTATVLFGLFATGSALQCFVCNSHADQACSDEFAVNSTALRTNFLKTCNTSYEGKEVVPFCRKTVMDVYIADSLRIQRDCGYERREGFDCYQKRSEDYIVNVCQCDKDFCNSANGLMFAPVLAVLAPLLQG